MCVIFSLCSTPPSQLLADGTLNLFYPDNTLVSLLADCTKASRVNAQISEHLKVVTLQLKNILNEGCYSSLLGQYLQFLSDRTTFSDDRPHPIETFKQLSDETAQLSAIIKALPNQEAKDKTMLPRLLRNVGCENRQGNAALSKITTMLQRRLETINALPQSVRNVGPTPQTGAATVKPGETAHAANSPVDLILGYLEPNTTESKGFSA